MGVHGKEVEEEIFKNEYDLSICQESGLQTEKHFLHLWNVFQVFFFLDLPIVMTKTDFKAFWKYSAI